MNQNCRGCKHSGTPNAHPCSSCNRLFRILHDNYEHEQSTKCEEIRKDFEKIFKGTNFENHDIINSLVDIFMVCAGEGKSGEKQRVMKPTEQWLRYCDGHPIKRSNIEYGELCHQNGRLERDLELMPLVEAAKTIARHYAGSCEKPAYKDRDALCNAVLELKHLNPKQ